MTDGNGEILKQVIQLGVRMDNVERLPSAIERMDDKVQLVVNGVTRLETLFGEAEKRKAKEDIDCQREQKTYRESMEGRLARIWGLLAANLLAIISLAAKVLLTGGAP